MSLRRRQATWQRCTDTVIPWGKAETKMYVVLKNLRSDESGQDLIEYALIAALIGLATVAAISNLAASISNLFTNLGNAMGV